MKKLILCLCLTGCVTNITPEADAGTAINPVGIGCVDDFDCFEDTYCAPGAKVCTKRCKAEQDCGNGGTCVSGWCSRLCTLDSECEGNTRCSKAYCSR